MNSSFELSKDANVRSHNHPHVSQSSTIADCASWVPRPTLLDLWTNWTYKCTQKRTCSYVGFTVIDSGKNHQ